MKTCTLSAIFTLLILARLATAQGNLIVNGGFASNANGWTIINAPGGLGYQSIGGNPGGSVLLDNVSPSLASDPTASQTVSNLTLGVVYLVSGDYLEGKNRGGGVSTDPSFGVAINSVFLFTAVAPGNFNWQHFSFSYTAIASNALLSLSSQINGTGISYTVDNLAVQAVPEPGVLGLAGLGVLFLCWRMRRPGQIT